MKTTTGLLTAGLLCVGLLAGCASGGGESPSSTPSVSVTPSSTSAQPTTAADQAKTAAVETARRFVQMTQVDILTGEATLDDLPKVAAQPLLDLQRKGSRDLLTEGWVSKTGGQVTFEEMKVLSATPKANPKTVTVRFCADATHIDYQRLDKSGQVVETNHGAKRGTKATVEAKDYGDGWFLTHTEFVEC